MPGKRRSSAPSRARQSDIRSRRHHSRLQLEALEPRAMLTVVAGQIDDFQSGTAQGWTNGSPIRPDPTNSDGGPAGAGDRYLRISSGTFGGASRLVSFNITQWIGDYLTAGVTGISMDLKNTTASPESIRIALRASNGAQTTPGYASTNKFDLPADNAWHHAFFPLDEGSLTAVNSPAPWATFMTSVGELRILESSGAPALIGDAGNFQIGVDNIQANTTTVTGSPRLFYKDSTKWNVTNGATFSDDNAIAPDKTAYLPGSGTSSFAAVSSYDKGINGLMVDLSGAHGAITANDFTFKRGNNNSPNAWVAATAPTTVTTRAGAGQSASDRIELLWDNNDSVKKQWQEVIVEGNDTLGGFNTNTGLTSSYVFYFGNALGDSGTGNAGAFQVTSTDEVNARNNPKTFTATRSDVNDFNRDGSVNSSDQIIARNNITNLGNQLKFLVVGAGGPFAPESSGGGGGDSGVASSLAIGSSPGSAPSGSAPPGWLARRVDEVGSAVAATLSGNPAAQTAISDFDEGTPDDDSLGALLLFF
jgi:hypothetical protein